MQECLYSIVKERFPLAIGYRPALSSFQVTLYQASKRPDKRGSQITVALSSYLLDFMANKFSLGRVGAVHEAVVLWPLLWRCGLVFDLACSFASAPR